VAGQQISGRVDARQGWSALLAHPLFATLVPVWFAAAFALSSLAVRGAIIERWVLASQIDLILPMATPPLGNTARILIALGFGVLGAVLGWLVVRLIVPVLIAQPAQRSVRPASEPSVAGVQLRRADAHPDAPARQPIWAHAELGEHGFDRPPAALAPVVQAPAPISVLAPVAEAGASYAPPPPPAEESGWNHAPVTLDALGLSPVAPEPKAEAPIASPVSLAPAPKTPLVGFPSPPVNGPSAADQIAEAPLESLSHIELIERLAIAMQRHEETVAPSGAPETPTPAASDGTAAALRAALGALRQVR